MHRAEPLQVEPKMKGNAQLPVHLYRTTPLPLDPTEDTIYLSCMGRIGDCVGQKEDGLSMGGGGIYIASPLAPEVKQKGLYCLFADSPCPFMLFRALNCIWTHLVVWLHWDPRGADGWPERWRHGTFG